MRSTQVVAVLLALMIPMAGCMSEDSEASESTFVVGEPVPELTAPDQHGETVTLSDMEGTMLVLLLNMGEWCPYCEQATENATALIEDMEAMDDRYNVSFVEVLGSNAGSEAANQSYATQWSNAFNTSHAVLHSNVSREYVNGVAVGFPTYAVVDPAGVLRLTKDGVNTLTAEDVQEQYEAYLSAMDAGSADS